MSGRNKCLQYNTTKNDRGTMICTLYFKSKQKNHTLMLFNIYT